MAKLGICVDNLFAVRRRLDMLSSNLMCLQKSLGIFDRVLDTPSRHNQADACFCTRLFVSLASPWILPLGNVQINSTLPSLIRTLACAEDTPARQNANEFAFDKPSAMPNFVRVLPRRENGCRERTIKRKKNADQRTASRPSRKLSRSA